MNLFPRGLSGRLLVVTAAFIMLTEVLIFVPSVANYRLTWLARHFNTGEAASVALEQLMPEDTSGAFANQLLDLTQTEMIVVRRDGMSRVLVSRSMPRDVDATVVLREPGRVQAVGSITEAFATLLSDGSRTIRIVGPMQSREGELELVLPEAPLREAMLSYAGNVLLISFFISLAAAMLVFLVLRWLLIRPMQRLTGSMLAFSDDPEDPTHAITPSGRRDEIGVAEEQLAAMQGRLRGTMTQRRHLAELGLAVSKINHDLRNVLTAASLFVERLKSVADPRVQRVAPRLLASIDRAAGYAQNVMDYGRAGEAVPEKRPVPLRALVFEVADTLGLNGLIDNAVAENVTVQADPDQLFRVLANLARNASQALADMDDATVRVTGDPTTITVSDNGPGIAAPMRDTLFQAFATGGKAGGTGLGLAIAAELVRAHGGTIALVEGEGATFVIELPG
ncbi:HAMP domain-containing histidine kinase [Rhizobiaceae bacterium]|nr:HAMP domain-containing histidine kinase [Rhizobiaceae bacterium]